MFTRFNHWSLSSARLIHSTPSHLISLTIILFSSYLHSGLPCGLIPSDFLTKIMYASLISPIHTTYPTNLILFEGFS
jgi:hypothetical protein